MGWLGKLGENFGGGSVGRILPQRWRKHARQTTFVFVNAAVVEGWEQYKVKNEAVAVRI